MKNAVLNVDLDALLYNFRHLKCFYKKNIIAVLKDDAYGLNLIAIANTLKNEENVIFAVSSIDEAISLRNNDISNDILLLSVFEKEDIEQIKNYNITVTIHSYSQLLSIKNTSINFHLKFNCGMNRLGIYIDEKEKVIKEVNNNINCYNLKGIMTHFANNDKDHKSYYSFEKIVNKINKKDLIIHCFASESLSENSKDITNYIRVGIKLYGIGERNMFLQNVVSIYSPILECKKIKVNELVGYDYLFKTPANGYLYILPLGYAKGFGSFNESFIYYEGIYLKQAGKISMDYSTYFSTKLIKKDRIFEVVGKHISIEQLCKTNHIKPHEFLVKLKLPIKYYKKQI